LQRKEQENGKNCVKKRTLICISPRNSFGDIIQEMTQAGHATGMGEKRYASRVLVGKPEGKRQMEDLSVEGE
jgi:hypothetical protein